MLSAGLSVFAFDYFFLPRQFHIFVSSSSYLRLAGFIGMAICINRLIASKQRVEESHREIEDQYRVIAETALDAIISTDGMGKIGLVNSAASRVFGYPAEELIGLPVTMILPQFLYGGRPLVTELSGIRKDGTEFSAEVSFGEVVIKDQRALAGFVRDITERKLAESGLRRSESYLAQAQRLSRTGSFGWDVSSGEIFWSEETFRIAGIDPEAKPTLELIKERVHPEDRARVIMAMDSAAMFGADLDFEHRFLLPDGSIKFVHVLGEPVRVDSGHIEYIGAAMDITSSKLAEEELRKSEEKYRELVDLSPDAIYVVDSEGVLVSTNEAGLDMLGCTAEQARDLRIVDTHLPEDKAAYFMRLQGLRAGSSFRFERTLVRTDGSQVPVDVAASPIRNGLSQAVVRDISERKRSELELRRSEAYLAEAERISRTGSWAWAPNTHEFNYWSAEMYRIFERDPHLGPPSLEEQRTPYPVEDWASVIQALEMSIRDKVDLDYECQLVFPSGSIKYIRVVGHPILGSANDVIEIVGSTRDITEQRVANDSLRTAFAELKKSEEQLRTIIDTIPILAWRTEPDGSSEFLNKRWLRYTGFSPEQAKNGGWRAALHPEDEPRFMKAWHIMLANGRSGEIEARMRRVDGDYRWFLIRTRPLRNELGQIVNWYGTNTDIDDLRHAQEALRKTEARLARAAQIATVGELAASIAHEINQPLTAIVANAYACIDWLSDETTDVTNARSMAEEIVRDGNDAAEVVRRMRTLFRGSAPQQALIDMNEVIEEMLPLLRGETVRKRIRVELDLEDDLPPILGDRVQMQQVLVNLCVNGIEAMESVVGRAKTLVIRSMVDCANAVRVEIQDQGMGLQQADRIFEAFFTTKQNGMGMGLSICRSIVESHGGCLWPISGQGFGTTFCFTIPVKPGERT
jgi:PAS domain S-box-containing protein